MRFIYILLACFLTQCAPEVPVKGMAKSTKPYCVKGACYKPLGHYTYSEKGLASWYGPGFHGKKSASGQRYNQHHYTAAHRTLPLPTIVKVTNLENQKSIVVLITDRGPYSSTIHKGCKHTYKKRIIDLSSAAMKALGGIKKGVIPVHIESFPQESQEFAEFLLQLKQRHGKEAHFVKAFHKIYA